MNYREVTDERIIESIRNGYKKTKLFNILDAFQKEGIPIAEVDTSEYVTPCSCTASLKASIKRYRFVGLDVITKGDKSYLVNKEALDEAENTESD